jgi:hypothetical protein
MYDDAKPAEALSFEERELETTLRMLSPVAPAISRDRLMFHAGRAIGRRSVNLWRSAAAALVVVFGLSLVVRPDGPVVREIIYVDRVVERSDDNPTGWPARFAFAGAERNAAGADVIAVSGESNYLVLRDRALRWGVAAAIPLTSGIARPEQPLRLDDLLDLPSQDPPASRPAGRGFPNGPFPGEHL